MASPVAVAEPTGDEVGERLHDAEGRHERQGGALRGEAELPLREEGQDAPLQADHRADERVDEDEQRELPPVLVQAEGGRPAVARAAHPFTTAGRSPHEARSG